MVGLGRPAAWGARRGKGAAIAIVLALAAAAVPAQPARSERRVLLYFEASPAQNPGQADLVYLHETLLARLQREELVMLEAAHAPPVQTDQARGQRAVEGGADSWVRVIVTAEGQRLSLAVSAVDLLAGATPVLDRSYERSGLRGVEGPFWDEVAEAIASALPPTGQGLAATAVRTGTVTVRALAGTTISGLGPQTVEVGENGTARVELTRPGFYSIEARREGSLTLRETRYLTADDTEVELLQKPTPGWMFEGYTLNVSYLGASAAEIFGPFYFRLGLTTYVLAPWLRNEGDDQADASLSLTDFAAAFGYQPFGREARVRPYLDVSAIVRVMHAGGSFAVEPVAPFGYRAAAGVEVSAAPRLGAFMDYGPVFYDVHDADPDAVGAAISVQGERSSGYFYKPWWGGVFDGVMVDLVAFRLGVRWYR